MYRGMMACEYQCKKFLSTSKYISEIETISDIGDVTKMFFSLCTCTSEENGIAYVAIVLQ